MSDPLSWIGGWHPGGKSRFSENTRQFERRSAETRKDGTAKTSHGSSPDG
jgi:hypothetical protein